MTFNIDTLNGVVFQAGSFSVESLSQTPGDVTYSNGTFTANGSGTASAIIGSGEEIVTVVNDTYKAPYPSAQGGNYTAFFGVLKFTATTPDGTPIPNQFTYATVIGFNDHQLLLTYLGSTPSTFGAPATVFYNGPFSPTGYLLTYGFPSTNNVYNNASAPASMTFQAPPPPCFAQGTRISTARGNVAVEDLVEGDEVITASGSSRPVIWIGSRNVRPYNYSNANQVHPVRIRAGAFAENVPSRDLLLSPGHAVFVDGSLVPAGHLVNGATIVQEEVEQIRYFHVELDAHDVLLAEGLPSESYLDDGNREVFGNAPDHIALYGRLDPVDWEGACAPVLRDWMKDAEALAAIRARLHARALDMGWQINGETDLTILADNVSIMPLHQAGNRVWFKLPPAESVKLVSRQSRPFDVIPGNLDTRNLGVAVGELRVNGDKIDLSADMFGEGFYPLESHGDTAWRWTNGEASLSLQGPALVEVAIHMSAHAWTRPATRLRLVAAN